MVKIAGMFFSKVVFVFIVLSFIALLFCPDVKASYCNRCCQYCRSLYCGYCPPPNICSSAVCFCDDDCAINPNCNCICERGGCEYVTPTPTPTPPEPICGGNFCVGDELWFEQTDCTSYFVRNCGSTNTSNWYCKSSNQKEYYTSRGYCLIGACRESRTYTQYSCPYGCATAAGVGNCRPMAVIRTTPDTNAILSPMTNVMFSCNHSIEPECGNSISLNPSSCTFAACTNCTCNWSVTKAGIIITTSNQKEFSYVFDSSGSYRVELIACDEANTCVTDVRIVNVANIPPVADFVVIPSQGIIGKTSFEMNASASYDPDGTIVDYNWSFGDGNTTAGGKATHEKVFHTYYRSFVGSQIFTVTLTVMDNSGNFSRTSRDVNVKNNPPKATFSAVPLEGVKPLTVIFKANTKDDDGHVVTCDWNFGDGNSASGCESIHTYYNSGSYKPKLIVRDQFGAEIIYDLDILVYKAKAVTGLTVKNTKVLTDTIAIAYCSEGIDDQNNQLIIEDQENRIVADYNFVPCSLNGGSTILSGRSFREPGAYKATFIALNCEGMECTKTTSFNVYEEAEVATPEMNILAVFAAVLFVIILVKSEKTRQKGV